MNRCPHQFSGGQRQRIAIARAIALGPKYVVLDEPTSALDVSVQARILNLLNNLQRRLGVAYLFISHNLEVIRYMADAVAVMYLGKIVEMGSTKDIHDSPVHYYTRALLEATPVPDPDSKRNKVLLTGDAPSPINPPSGCRFHPRCSNATPKCKEREPKMIDMGHEHLVACHACGD
jgi:oligopeptide/dipeptide ABC transporter ATP-binding protein